MMGCNPWYTDSCCKDYVQECQLITIPPCLDARTQGSAVNLFVAHLRVEQLSKGFEIQ